MMKKLFIGLLLFSAIGSTFAKSTIGTYDNHIGEIETTLITYSSTYQVVIRTKENKVLIVKMSSYSDASALVSDIKKNVTLVCDSETQVESNCDLKSVLPR
jgi:hypothetical protein